MVRVSDELANFAERADLGLAGVAGAAGSTDTTMLSPQGEEMVTDGSPVLATVTWNPPGRAVTLGGDCCCCCA